jgi:hypothetical protein
MYFNIRKLVIKIIPLTIIVFFVFASPVEAAFKLNQASSFADNARKKAGVEQTNVGDIVGTGIRGALQLVGIFFFILMVYGGFVWMTARGNEERIVKARKVIIGAVIGVAVTVMAYAITTFLGRVAPGPGGGASTAGAVCTELPGLGEACDPAVNPSTCPTGSRCNSNRLCQGETGLCENTFGACGAYSCNDSGNCKSGTAKTWYCPGGNNNVCCIPR